MFKIPKEKTSELYKNIIVNTKEKPIDTDTVYKTLNSSL